MLNVPLSLCDQIEIERTTNRGIQLGSIEIDCSKMQPGAEKWEKEFLAELNAVEKNLAARAAQAFFKKFGIDSGVIISIIKRIPKGSGMGGGSSDAAAVLRGLRAMFLSAMDEELSAKMVIELGTSIGADVPFFLMRGAQVVQGIGEIVVPLPRDVQERLNGFPVLIIVPDLEMPTPKVYARFRELNPELKDSVSDSLAPLSLEGREITGRFRVSNDLEQSIVSISPDLGRLLAEVRALGVGQASFTGSGSAIFVIPQNETGLDQLYQDVLALVQSSTIPCRVFTEQIRTL